MGTFRLRCVAVLAFSILTVLPVTGMLCELLCASPIAASTPAAGARHPAAPCHEADGDETTIGPASGHDCTRHEAVTPEPDAWLAAARPITVEPPVASLLSAKQLSARGSVAAPAILRGGPSGPPDGFASARPPLVLRI